MEIVTEKVTSKTSVLRIKGRIDAVSAPELEKAVTGVLNENGSGCIINLAEVDYMSSAGIRVLVLGSKISTSESGLFYVCSLQSSVKKVLEIVGFLPLLHIFADEDSAVSAAREKLSCAS